MIGAKHENYNVPVDELGNSILTGDGKDREGDSKFFTLAALETYVIQF